MSLLASSCYKSVIIKKEKKINITWWN
jgi:hypothetical protein